MPEFREGNWTLKITPGSIYLFNLILWDGSHSLVKKIGVNMWRRKGVLILRNNRNHFYMLSQILEQTRYDIYKIKKYIYTYP